MKNNLIYFIASVVFGYLILNIGMMLDESGSFIFALISPLLRPLPLLFIGGIVLAFVRSNILMVIVGTVLGQFLHVLLENLETSSSVGDALYLLGVMHILGSGLIVLVGNKLGKTLHKIAINS